MSTVKEVLSTSIPQFHTIIFGALVLVLIIWCPGGLVQAIEVLRRRFKPGSRSAARGALR
jgi:ABC-type branched-subunit amino acid transport system permease subunit